MEEKIVYQPTDGDVDNIVAFFDGAVENILSMHYGRGYYPIFVKEYMQKGRKVSFMDCMETDLDEMIEDPATENSLDEPFVPVVQCIAGDATKTVGDWIDRFVATEVVDSLTDGHASWIEMLENDAPEVLRGLLVKIDARLINRMSGPQNYNTVKSYAYQAISAWLYEIAYKVLDKATRDSLLKNYARND